MDLPVAEDVDVDQEGPAGDDALLFSATEDPASALSPWRAALTHRPHRGDGGGAGDDSPGRGDRGRSHLTAPGIELAAANRLGEPGGLGDLDVLVRPGLLHGLGLQYGFLPHAGQSIAGPSGRSSPL